MTRRSALTTAAWSVPVIGLALAAPSYATSSTPDPTPDVDPVVCRRPGMGDYFVRTRHRDGVVIGGVTIDGRPAAPGPHGWEVRDFGDSRVTRPVTVTYVTVADEVVHHWTRKVRFDVCEDR